MDKSVLGQGIQYNPNTVGVQGVDKVGYTNVSGTNVVEGIAKVGIHILDEISKQNRAQANAEYKMAVDRRDKIMETNQNIAYSQYKDLIDKQHTDFINSLTGDDYLNANKLQSRRQEWQGGITGVIANDGILDVYQKQKLKSYLNGKSYELDKDITAKNYKAQLDNTILRTMNQREDNKVQIGLAIQSGNQDVANRLIVEDRKYRKFLAKLDPERYNHEWDNKEGSELTVFAGYSVVHKLFLELQQEYLKNPTDENYRKFERAIFDRQNELTKPEFLMANFGSKHGLENEEFIDKIRILGSKILNEGRTNGKSLRKGMESERKKTSFDYSKDANSSYRSDFNLDFIPREAYSPSGNFFSQAYSVTNQNFLEKNKIAISSNQELFDFISKNPNVPLPAFNIIPESAINELKNDYASKNDREALNKILSFYGQENMSDEVESMIDNELSTETNGELSLRKLKVLNEREDNDKYKDFREAIEISRNSSNIGLPRGITNQLGERDIVTGNKKTIPFSDINNLRNLALNNNYGARVVNDIQSDINNVAMVLAFNEMSESQRKSFKESQNIGKQAEMLEDVIDGNDELQKKIQKMYQGILTGYLGNDRPFSVNGFSFVADKDFYDEKYVEREVDKIGGNKTLFFDRGGKTIQVGRNNAMNSSRVFPDENGNLQIYLENEPLYEIVNGEKVPAIIKPMKKEDRARQEYDDFYNNTNNYYNIRGGY